jgi:hypothetical protein
MAAEDERRYVLHAHLQFLSNEGAEAGGIEHARHADDALTRESAEFEGGLRHGVERVGDDN